MAKIWKKLLLVILIVACLFNVVSKIVKRYSLKEEMQSSIQYIKVDVCSKCHPFWTGNLKRETTGGRAAKFREKYGIQ